MVPTSTPSRDVPVFAAGINISPAIAEDVRQSARAIGQLKLPDKKVCFPGTRDGYCLISRGSGMGQIVSEKTGSPLTGPFAIGQETTAWALDFTKDGADEVYVVRRDFAAYRGDVATVFDLATPETPVKDMNTTLVPYDYDVIGDDGCGGSDILFDDNWEAVNIRGGIMTIWMDSGDRGGLRYVVAPPRIYLALAGDYKYDFEETDLEIAPAKGKALKILECAYEKAKPEDRPLVMGGILMLEGATTSRMDLGDAPADFHPMEVSFTHAGKGVELESVREGKEGPITKLDISYYWFKAGFGWWAKELEITNSEIPAFYPRVSCPKESPCSYWVEFPGDDNKEEISFVRGALNAFLEGKVTDVEGRQPTDAENVRLILKALDAPRPAWLK